MLPTSYPDFNQRVKKAHEQIALESEIAAQVRKDMMSGKANKFKSAINSSVILPIDEKQMKEKASRGKGGERDSSGNGPELSVSGMSRLPAHEPPTDSPSNRNTRVSLTHTPAAAAEGSSHVTPSPHPQPPGRFSANLGGGRPGLKVSARSPMASPSAAATTSLGNVGPLQLDSPAAAVAGATASGRPSRGVELTPAGRQSTVRGLSSASGSGGSAPSEGVATGPGGAVLYSRLLATPSISQ